MSQPFLFSGGELIRFLVMVRELTQTDSRRVPLFSTRNVNKLVMFQRAGPSGLALTVLPHDLGSFVF
jgi:hypothetical protein